MKPLKAVENFHHYILEFYTTRSLIANEAQHESLTVWKLNKPSWHSQGEIRLDQELTSLTYVVAIVWSQWDNLLLCSSSMIPIEVFQAITELWKVNLWQSRK